MLSICTAESVSILVSLFDVKFFKLAHIPIIRVLFKFGLNAELQPLSLDQYGNKTTLNYGDIHLSLHKKAQMLFLCFLIMGPLLTNGYLTKANYFIVCQPMKWVGKP